jgi:TRAP transporter TAXI family solute receptor
MRRTMIITLITVLAILTLAVQHGANAAPAQEKPKNLPPFIVLATNPPGGLLNILGNGLAKMIDEKGPFGVRLRQQTYGFATIVNDADAHLSLNNAVDSHQALHAIEGYAGKPHKKIRIVAAGPQFAAAFMVKKDSPMLSVADLKGKKVTGKFISQPPAYFDAVALLTGVDLKWDDVSVVPVSSVTEGTQAFIQGNVVAACLAVGSALVQQADATLQGVRFLTLPGGKEVENKIWKAVPGYLPLPVKKGYALGVDRDMILVAKPIYLLSGVDIDPAIVYEVTKVVWNHMETVYSMHQTFKEWTHEAMLNPKMTVPYHDGAIRFYKEVGKWTPELEQAQKELLQAVGK